jgi:hypothetical protein
VVLRVDPITGEQANLGGVIEFDLLRGSLGRMEFSVAHDSKSCPPTTNAAGVPLEFPAVQTPGYLADWVPDDWGCVGDEYVPAHRNIALFGATMEPATAWSEISGTASTVWTSAVKIDLYPAYTYVMTQALLPFELPMAINFDATDSDLSAGLHETTLKVRYREYKDVGSGTMDPYNNPDCIGGFAETGGGSKLCGNVRTLELDVRFTVIEPTYFLLSAPTQLAVEMAAGSSREETFQLFNAMPGPLAWHVACADLPTAAGGIQLSVADAVPCGVGTPSALGVIPFQGDGALTVTVTAPEIVQTEVYTYSLGIPATNENGVTIPQQIPFMVTVVAKLVADPTNTELVILSDVTAGEPMTIEVQAKDQFDNAIGVAGLDFQMVVTLDALNPGAPWTGTFSSRFTVDGYVIDTAAMPRQGTYALTGYIGNDPDLALLDTIQSGGDDSFTFQVQPVTCDDGNAAPDADGVVCICSPGHGPGADACVPCSDTAAGGTGTLHSAPGEHEGECVPCADGTRPNLAQSDCEVCAPGEAGVGGMCAACDAGKTPVVDRSECQTCPSGQQPSTEQTTCENCLPGYATDVGNCQQCDAGKTPVADGSACQMCPAGKQPTTQQTTCENCLPGYATDVGNCLQCDGNMIPVDDEARCEVCPAGKQPNDAQSDCEDCLPGYATDVGNCQQCDAGKTPVADGSACQMCPAGKEPAPQQTTCENCLPGYATDVGNCQQCDDNMIPVDDEAQCEVCPAGKQPNDDQSDCVQCPVGQAAAMGACAACITGWVPVPSAAGDAQARCEVCLPLAAPLLSMQPMSHASPRYIVCTH